MQILTDCSLEDHFEFCFRMISSQCEHHSITIWTMTTDVKSGIPELKARFTLGTPEVFDRESIEHYSSIAQPDVVRLVVALATLPGLGLRTVDLV